MKRSLPLFLLCTPFLLLAAGCADPAADAPDAVVKEAAPEPAAAPAEEMAVTYGLSESLLTPVAGMSVLLAAAFLWFFLRLGLWMREGSQP